MRAKSVLKSISFAFIANIISLICSVFITFFIPKFLGITQYSYFQLYIFYISYVGFLGFGWIEGLYLRYGGYDFDSLDYSKLHSQFKRFIFLELIISIIIVISTVLFFRNTGIEKQFIFICFGITVIVYMPRAWLHNLLQATGRIKEYSIGLIIDKVVYLLIVVLLLILKVYDFRYIIIGEIFGKTIGSIYIFVLCSKILKAKEKKIKQNIVANSQEIKEDILSGISLMVSNVSSMLIIGIVRQMIEKSWSIEIFGKISLTLTLSNLIMIFVNSIAMVIFPILKHIKNENLSKVYLQLRNIIMLLLMCVLAVYYPFKTILVQWLPKYTDSLKYMAILFPICIFECKMSLLLNTYFKVLRKEKILLIINLCSMLISSLLAYISCFLIKSLDLSVIVILIVSIIRSIFAEIYICNELRIDIKFDMILEIILSILFVIFNYFITGILGFTLYVCFLCITLFIKKGSIQMLIKDFCLF